MKLPDESLKMNEYFLLHLIATIQELRYDIGLSTYHDTLAGDPDPGLLEAELSGQLKEIQRLYADYIVNNLKKEKEDIYHTLDHYSSIGLPELDDASTQLQHRAYAIDKRITVLTRSR